MNSNFYKIILPVYFLMAMSNIVQAAVVVKQMLHSSWQFRQERSVQWYPATVPGTVHTDLMDAHLIDDPYYRLNERTVQWVDKEDWIYKTKFNISSEIFKKENIELQFMGLDTYADVYLNDSLIIKANNMFREWKIDVKSLLKSEDNELRVYFRSPIKEDMEKYDKRPYPIFANNDQSQNGGVFDKKMSVFARKAGYHYGWDWGPRLVTSGIWRPIYIMAWDDIIIRNVHYIQKEIKTQQAKLKATMQVSSTCRGKMDWVIRSEGKEIARKTISLVEGDNHEEMEFNIDKPQLWWTNGLGDPHLYKFISTIEKQGNIQDSCSCRIGLRSLKVIRKEDKWGKSFYFELNGKPLFAKGANYIPQDCFLPRVTPERYRKTIMDAVKANMNMLRVWGGGIYENDLFYDLCDEHGILVWQDFMFACSVYPMTPAQLDNIRHEAIDNVIRLRNHPCIAIWCGNNENHVAWFGWKWMDAYGEKLAQARKDYKDVFHVLLPQVVSQFDEQSFYWPSSPYAGNPDARCEKPRPDINPEGDAHYWGVWGGAPIDSYNHIRARFFSEYGFQSFPEYQSILRYAPEAADHQIYSDVMMSHQRGGSNANARIEKYMKEDYRETSDFRQQLYIGQLMQGDAIKTAIESHRRQKPYNMGSLFWQHNDCWPVASWSSRDYFGRWKAQHYYARKAFKDLLVSPILEDDKLNVYIVSDRLKTVKGRLDIKLVDFYGHVIYRKNKHISIQANTSSLQFSEPVRSLLNNRQSNEVFVYATFQENGKSDIYDNYYFLVLHKKLSLPNACIKVSVSQVSDGYNLTLCSNNFVRGVFLSIKGIDNFFSDNYFSLYPQQATTIHVTTDLKDMDDFIEQFKCETFNPSHSIEIIRS